jgi:hypothetical protein
VTGNGTRVLTRLPYGLELLVDLADVTPWFRYKGSLSMFRPHELNRAPLVAPRLRDALQEYADHVDDDATDKRLPWFVDPGHVATLARMALEMPLNRGFV